MPIDEFEFIEKYLKPLSFGNKSAIGLQDDAAFITANKLKKGLVVSTDTIVENIHFRANDNLDYIGRKLVRTNISDILAKGAKPCFAFFNFTWPKSRTIEEMVLVAKGLGLEFNTDFPLLGGDITRSKDTIVLSLTIFGKPHGKKPVLRHKAKSNDDIWLSGEIGNAWAALNFPENGLEAANAHYQLPQIPPNEIAELIAELATSSLDVSDGLIGDAQKLCQKNLKIQINLEDLPISKELQDLKTKSFSNNEIEFYKNIASFGDDYQCVFTVAKKKQEELLKTAKKYSIKLTKIGSIIKDTEHIFHYYGEKIYFENTSFRHF